MISEHLQFKFAAPRLGTTGLYIYCCTYNQSEHDHPKDIQTHIECLTVPEKYIYECIGV